MSELRSFAFKLILLLFVILLILLVAVWLIGPRRLQDLFHKTLPDAPAPVPARGADGAGNRISDELCALTPDARTQMIKHAAAQTARIKSLLQPRSPSPPALRHRGLPPSCGRSQSP